jgi:hypothetical protein
MDPAPPPPFNPAPPRPGWWQRNWKWFVPTGCLSLLVLGAAFIFFIFAIVLGALKSSDAYKTALAKAQADPRVVSALGSPVKAGLFVTGKTNVSGSSGNADLTVPLSGPNGSGTLYFVAAKFAGDWTFSKMVVTVEKTGEKIDLLPANSP